MTIHYAEQIGPQFRAVLAYVTRRTEQIGPQGRGRDLRVLEVRSYHTLEDAIAALDPFASVNARALEWAGVCAGCGRTWQDCALARARGATCRRGRS